MSLGPREVPVEKWQKYSAQMLHGNLLCLHGGFFCLFVFKVINVKFYKTLLIL